ncbi:MAG: indole-3-glycerol-phosphate synthase [Alphaproteobacteria bacterium]|nr:indole-3-glycerol-phosphate synthase [Alphaproteobacteria bacterium]MCB9698554.1 indole-3-glycerol-phosphate synthase [Alphaproteobacteria bacterium]
MLALREPQGVLGAIVARTVADLDRSPASSRTADAPRGLREALRRPADAPRHLSLLAEVKPRSPSAGDLGARVERLLPVYDERAAAISVLVDGPHFGGSFALLSEVRAAVQRPVLAKGFFVDPSQLDRAWAAGADGVLLMAALLPPASLVSMLAACEERGLDALVEAHDATELAEVLDAGATLVGVNSRDLRTLTIDLGRARDLLATIPEGPVRLCESGLHTRADVDAVRGLCDAVLVGTALVTAPDPRVAVEELGL